MRAQSRRRPRSDVPRWRQIKFAVSDAEYEQLHGRANELGITLSRLLVEGAIAFQSPASELSSRPQISGVISAAGASPAARSAAPAPVAARSWEGVARSAYRDALDALPRGREHLTATNIARHEEFIGLAVEEEIAVDRAGNRPAWVAKVLMPETLANKAGPRTAAAWQTLIRDIARLRIDRGVSHPNKHGLRGQIDSRVYDDISELAKAIRIPTYLGSAGVKLRGETLEDHHAQAAQPAPVSRPPLTAHAQLSLVDDA